MQSSEVPPEYPFDSRQYPDTWQPAQILPPTGPATTHPEAPRGYVGIAWTVIVLCIVIGMVLHVVAQRLEKSGQGGKDELGIALMEVQAKYAIGATEITSGSSGDRALVYNSMAEAMNQGSIDQRQRFIVLAGEMMGADEATQRLNELDRLIADEAANRSADDQIMTDEQKQVRAILRNLYEPDESQVGTDVAATQPDAATSAPASLRDKKLTPAEKTILTNQLGWFGKLALASDDAPRSQSRQALLKPAKIVAGAIIAAAALGIFAGLAGFIASVLLVIFAFLGKLASGMRWFAAHHGIYAETFAVWMVLFMALQVGAGVLGAAWPQGALLLAFFGFFGSLLALGWPVLRGIPFVTVRSDIGWSRGRQPLSAEIALGPAGYVMGLPIFAIGVAITFGLLVLQQAFSPERGALDPVGGPAHPIITELINSNWAVRIQLVMLGSIAAPVVEETMFRGVLYRHLRDATRKWGAIASILASAAINSFIFAIIHPQGWVAVPALMALAINFSLMREWRGTLLPAMIMHAIQNGLVFGLLIFIFSMQ